MSAAGRGNTRTGKIRTAAGVRVVLSTVSSGPTSRITARCVRRRNTNSVRTAVAGSITRFFGTIFPSTVSVVGFDQNIALTLAVVRSFFITANRKESRITARTAVNGNTNNVRTATAPSGTKFIGKTSRITARSAISGRKNPAHIAIGALSSTRFGGTIHRRCVRTVTRTRIRSRWDLDPSAKKFGSGAWIGCRISE